MSSDLDSKGTPFDAAKHLPKKNAKTGRWMPRGGRKPKSQTLQATPNVQTVPPPAAPVTPDPQPTAPQPEPMPNFDDIEKASGKAPEAQAEIVNDNATAETIIGVVQTALVLIGAEEGVLSDIEKELLRRPLVRVLEKYNVGKDVLPAEAELALAMATLIITRLQRPKTATWFAKVKAWFVGKYFQREGQKLARQVRDEVTPKAA